MSNASDDVPSVSNLVPYYVRSDMNLAASSSVFEGLPDEQRTSPVRRTFLLAMLFDLLLSFILWIIFVQQSVSTGGIQEALRHEVVDYTFKTSLFDTMLLACCRFLVIEVAYGIFVLRTPWWSAVVTGSTSTVLVAKCFLFDFHQPDKANSQLAYALIISAIILTWVETSFLIYRVIPMEKAAQHVATSLFGREEQRDELRSLLSNQLPKLRRYRAQSPRSGYFTPVGGDSIFGDHFYTPAIPRPETKREAAIDAAGLLTRASQLYSEVWYLHRLEVWKPQALSGADDCTFSSTHLQGYQFKLFRLEVNLDAPPDTVFRDLVFNVAGLTRWNKNIDVIEQLQCLPSENVDVIYYRTHNLLGGVISARDFVLLRTWGEHEGVLYLASTSVEHPMHPPRSDCVRAHQLINAYIFEPVGEDRSRCKLTWFMCNDIKSYAPQRLTDNAVQRTMPVMVQGLKDLFQRGGVTSESCLILSPR